MTRKANPIGRCALCLNDGVELQKSHLIPAGVYRRLRDGNRDPGLIRQGKIVPTSRQTWTHLLCSDCENRLNVRGEAWILRNGLQGDRSSFPLLEYLANTKAVSADATMSIFQPAVSSKYEPCSIAYFAASIFWRAGVHSWGQPEIYPIRIGVKYREQLRRYLMDLGPFPKRALLLTILRDISPVNTLTAHPCSIEAESLHHIFFACGFFFSLTLGDHVLDAAKQFCIVNGDRHPVVITNELESDLVNFSKRMSGGNRS